MARPTKYDEARAGRILDNLRRGNTRRASALSCGISEDSFARWLDRYADFAAAVKKAEAEAETAHVANISRWAQSGNWQASAWWLERRRKDDWRKPDEVNVRHSGPDGGAQQHEVRLTDDQLRAILGIGAGASDPPGTGDRA